MPKPKPPKGDVKGLPPAKKTDDEIAYDELKATLGHTRLMKANSAAINALAAKAAQSIAPSSDTWLTEWGGKGLGNAVFDLTALLEIGGALGNTVRWYARSLFDGGNKIGFPGARAALAGSLVLVLGPGLTEEPRYAGEEPFFPTVEGGLLLAETMASANDQDELTAIFSALTTSAAKAYVRTLEVMVARELSVTTYVAPEGEPPRFTRLVLEEARDDLAWLSRTPSTQTYEAEVIGTFHAVDDRNDGKFVISPEYPSGTARPADIVGKLAPDLRHRTLSTNTRVKAVIRVTEAKETWLPRAPRTERVLIAFERLSG